MQLARSLAVALISAGVLAYEILLVRVFAIEQFHHFAYMAIGVAMLGFGASGTLVALLPRLKPTGAAAWFSASGTLAALSLIATPFLVHRISLDPTQLAWNGSEWIRLAALYLVLAVPFGLGALAILLALTVRTDRPGRVYGVSLVGSGGGTTIAIFVLGMTSPERALAVPAVITAFGAAAAAVTARRHRWATPIAWFAVVAAVFFTARPPWQLEITPYKGLPQVEAYPGARRVTEHSSPLGWVVAVDAPAFRYAPGLSLAFQGRFPRQQALFVDAQIVGAMSRWAEDSAARSVLDWLPTALPYALGAPETALVMGAGGGIEVQNAVAHGARHITAVELHPGVVALAAPMVSLEDPSIALQWVVGDGRSFLARSKATFDLITVAPAGGVHLSGAGVHSLNEDFLHTVEAYESYLERLSDEGVLAVTRWISLPPRASVRTILTAGRAVGRQVGDAAVARSMAVVRSWGTATVLVKPSGFEATEITALETWATTRLFDLDWPPRPDGPASVFNYLEQRTLERAVSAAAAGPDSAARFAAEYPFDVRPAVDARPYPHHFIRTASIGTFLQSDRAAWLPFAEWGQIALLATLLQSVLLGAVLTLLPVAIRLRRWQGRRLPSLVGYFGCLGLAYLAAEIAAIQQLSLLLGHPVYAVAAVLGAFLICSGLGSLWSDRCTGAHARPITLSLALTLVLYALLLLAVVHWLQSGPLLVRVGAAVFALAPLAFLMGIPFPVGLRLLGRGDAPRIAWAWASNGFASVVAAPLAAVIALEVGSPSLFLVAASAYAGAAIFARASGSQLAP